MRSIVILVTVFVASALLLNRKSAEKKSGIKLFAGQAMSDGGDDRASRYQWELMRLADPATGKIPRHIRAQELEFAKNLPGLYPQGFSNVKFIGYFQPRGPWNLGGRSRAIAVDITNENIIFAGSVNGGLFRSTDGGVTWIRVSANNTNPAVTWIEQDKRPGHTNTWYYTTGEGYGASASASGAYYLGNGVYKSTDGGITWNILTATSSGTAHTFDSFWDIVWRLKCDVTDTVNATIYAACYGAVYKSVNGGVNWSLERGSAGSPSYFMDVDITTTGAVYVTESSDGVQRGIWRKDEVNAWANISPPGWDTATYNRVVIGINPSNENEVYFLGETPFNGKMTATFYGDPEYNSLWKYTYVSGNGTGTGGIWEDLSQNLPYPGGQLANFNSQGGYDLVVKVHPADPNVVYIGGTNLYRSANGFTDTLSTVHIGGYDPTSTIPFYEVYPVHHPDQHAIFFLPSNPDVMFQANDGGIYKTMNARATPLAWQSLNNGFVTGQFYSVAIDHDASGGDIVIGGVQDNGTWFTNSLSLTSPWTQPGFGDGSFCAIDNGHNFYYISRQEGKTAKVQLDAGGNVIAFRRIDPIGGSGYLFINPFILDPNNNEVMYMAAGTKVFRNDSLSQIPLTGQWDTISTGWYQLPDTVNVTNTIVSALAVPKSNSSRLYYGTSRKKVYRVDDVNTFSPVTTDITSTLFNANGYVTCIAVDPDNDDHLVVAFSNYGMYSIFNSTDSGVTFTKCAGNLEANSQGVGAGPSVRWISILTTPSGDVYLAGTSIGIYGTNQLNGLSTIWLNLSPNEIGYMVTNMIDCRQSDGYVVAGTHGRGAFSMNISDTLLTGLGENYGQAGVEIQVFPNPASSLLSIRLTPSPTVETIELYNASGQKVKVIPAITNSDQLVEMDVSNFERGIYFIVARDQGGKGIRAGKVLIR